MEAIVESLNVAYAVRNFVRAGAGGSSQSL
jgi:hypothetical protein